MQFSNSMWNKAIAIAYLGNRASSFFDGVTQTELDWWAAIQPNISQLFDKRLRVGPNNKYTSNLNAITYVQRV